MKKTALILAMSLVTSLALADKDNKENKDKDKEKDKHGQVVADGGAAATTHADDDDDDAPATDGGKAVAGRRTPAQLTFRKELWERREKEIESRVHKNGKKLTDAERDAIKKHWITIGKLMRIRELAQDDKNDAVVKRVDKLIEKTEKNFDAKMEKLGGGAK